MLNVASQNPQLFPSSLSDASIFNFDDLTVPIFLSERTHVLNTIFSDLIARRGTQTFLSSLHKGLRFSAERILEAAELLPGYSIHKIIKKYVFKSSSSDKKDSEEKSNEKSKKAYEVYPSLEAQKRALKAAEAYPEIEDSLRANLIFAAKIDRLKLLKGHLTESIEQNARDSGLANYVNAQDLEGRTLLEIATMNANLKMMKYLISEGATLGPSYGAGRYLIYEAVELKNIEVLRLLLPLQRKLVINKPFGEFLLPDESLHHAYCRAVAIGFQEGADLIAKQLHIEKNKVCYETRDPATGEVIPWQIKELPMAHAIEEGNTDAVISAVMPYFEGSKPWTDSSTAMLHRILFKAVQEGQLKLIEHLARYIFNLPELEDAEDGRTLLQVAIDEDQIEVAKWLLTLPNAETFINLKDDEGLTALHHAVIYGCFELVETILNLSKLGLTIKNYDGQTPIEVAASMGQNKCLQVLLKACKGKVLDLHQLLSLAAQYGHSETFELLWQQFQPNVNEQNQSKVTLLHASIIGGNLTILSTLLSHPEIDVTLLDIENNTALELAVINGQLAMIEPLFAAFFKSNKEGSIDLHKLVQLAVRHKKAKVLNWLLDHLEEDYKSSYLRQHNVDGDTLLHESIMGGDVESVKVLLNHGANPHAVTVLGHFSPLQIAEGLLKMRQDSKALSPNSKEEEHNIKSFKQIVDLIREACQKPTEYWYDSI